MKYDVGKICNDFILWVIRTSLNTLFYCLMFIPIGILVYYSKDKQIVTIGDIAIGGCLILLSLLFGILSIDCFSKCETPKEYLEDLYNSIKKYFIDLLNKYKLDE